MSQGNYFDNTNKTLVGALTRNIYPGKDFDCLEAHTNVISSMFANKNSLVELYLIVRKAILV